jgi:hypothetical protein
MRTVSILFRMSVFIVLAQTFPAVAGHVMKDTIVGDYKIELHVLPAEPFFTAEEAAAHHATEGMLIMGGAVPLPPDADPRPNHHLVVHVYDAKTGKALTGANVAMKFRNLDDKGNLSGNPVTVPVVIMQAIGKGAESTHYGNNVIMPAGSYVVTVSVNGKKAGFTVAVSDSSTVQKEEMHMH